MPAQAFILILNYLSLPQPVRQIWERMQRNEKGVLNRQHGPGLQTTHPPPPFRPPPPLRPEPGNAPAPPPPPDVVGVPPLTLLNMPLSWPAKPSSRCYQRLIITSLYCKSRGSRLHFLLEGFGLPSKLIQSTLHAKEPTAPAALHHHCLHETTGRAYTDAQSDFNPSQ